MTASNATDLALAARLRLDRQWLHACSISFAHPADGSQVEYTSEYPAVVQFALDELSDAG